MKKIVLFIVAIVAVTLCGAQSLDEIANHYYEANGVENLEKAQTIVMEGIVSQMGMEIPISIKVKKENKLRVVQEFSGMEIIVVYDGEKAFTVNPMTGSTDPVEVPADQLTALEEYNLFNEQFIKAFRAGKAALLGEEAINNEPAFKISIPAADGSPSTIWISKESYRILKSTQSVNQMGQELEVETYINEYKEVDGIWFAAVTTQYINGMDFGGTTLNKIEVNNDISDTIFTIN